MSILRFLGLADADSVTSEAAPSDSSADTDTMRRIAAELEQMDEAQARYLAAFAYILGRVAHADSHFSDEETRKMEEVVRGLGHLTEAQAALAVEIAKSQVRLFGATENFLVTRRFKEMATPEQCVELLDCVFAVSAADDSISAVEEGQAGQISKELWLSHEDFVAARITYKEHLESLKRLRDSSDS